MRESTFTLVYWGFIPSFPTKGQLDDSIDDSMCFLKGVKIYAKKRVWEKSTTRLEGSGRKYPPGKGTKISHHKKRKLIFPTAFGWHMLVRRVRFLYICWRYLQGSGIILIAKPPLNQSTTLRCISERSNKMKAETTTKQL